MTSARVRWGIAGLSAHSPCSPRSQRSCGASSPPTGTRPTRARSSPRRAPTCSASAARASGTQWWWMTTSPARSCRPSPTPRPRGANSGCPSVRKPRPSSTGATRPLRRAHSPRPSPCSRAMRRSASCSSDTDPLMTSTSSSRRRTRRALRLSPTSRQSSAQRETSNARRKWLSASTRTRTSSSWGSSPARHRASSWAPRASTDARERWASRPRMRTACSSSQRWRAGVARPCALSSCATPQACPSGQAPGAPSRRSGRRRHERPSAWIARTRAPSG
mmetsp:Transcript_22363/g.60445  ORF Transcript_22363/g.60445 Transcript_22363/m.60445 type:complete len:277 (-) Transcript_22363:1459-2289(-)